MFFSRSKEEKRVTSNYFHSSIDDESDGFGDDTNENAETVQIEHLLDVRELRLFGVTVWSSAKTETTTTR